MPHLQNPTLVRLTGMILGAGTGTGTEKDKYESFPSRTGTHLESFIKDLGFAPDFSEGNGKAKWVKKTLSNINNLDAREPDRIASETGMGRVILQLMNPTAFEDLPPECYQNALQQINKDLRQYDLRVMCDHLDRVTLAPVIEDAARPPTPIATKQMAQDAKSPHSDVVILCALPTPELEMVKQLGDWTEIRHQRNDPTTYYFQKLGVTGGRTLRVVAAAASQMGMPAAAVLATKMLKRFNPKLLAIVGIAAGIKDKETDQHYGDILVADSTFDYGSGKLSSQDGKLHFSPDPRSIPIDPRLKERLKAWGEGEQIEKIGRKWPANRPPGSLLRMHTGPIGSGAAVLATMETVNQIRSHARKVIGIDMEAYGAHLACCDAISPKPLFLCMKSVSDFVHEKTDIWQRYAAYTAASALRQFLIDEWEKVVVDS